MDKTYAGKIILVTGGAQGIGLGIAKAFAAAGGSVIISDYDTEAGEEAADLLQQINKHTQFIYCDNSEEKQVQDLMQQIAEQHHHLDVLVNNAGIANPDAGPLEELDMAEFDRVLAVNLRGPLLCAKYALPLLRQAVQPAILQISSTRATMSEPNTFAYTASKGGVQALTHALAVSLTEPVIRVNAIAPGWIETGNWQKKEHNVQPQHSPQDKEQHPVKRVGIPEDIAAAALFLCSDKAGFITGQTFVIDGGMTVKMIYS